MKGLFAWIGYPQKAIPYERDARYGGETKWSYIALWNFAIEGITSFSTIPLKVATYLGVLTAFVAFLFGMFIVIKTLFFGNPVPGYPSLLVVVLFLGGIQLMALGVIGEYLGRMFIEIKGFMSVGYARKRLAYSMMPNWREVQNYAKLIAKAIGYKILDKHEYSRVVLLGKSKKDMKIKTP